MPGEIKKKNSDRKRGILKEEKTIGRKAKQESGEASL